MATHIRPSSSHSSHSPTRMSCRWARKCERYCCLGATYFPLFFVYSITTWAVWVEAKIGFLPAKTACIGNGTSCLGILLYILLNWSYTTAVFTSPGTTTAQNGYSTLPTQVSPVKTNFTVKSNGELRYCKKCQARKPDRAHHCSTCHTCVLKMDHHCPWLATCVGLRNYKAFLLFLIYTTLFCFVCFGVSGYWVWREILSEGEYTESLMPVNYVMLAVISGIIGLVLAGFTGWHMLLAYRGQTTIECLEKTRYLTPLHKSTRHHNDYPPSYVQPLIKANTTNRPYLDERQNYEVYDRLRAQQRYDEYLNEQESDKLPSAFDLGWKRNLLHLFGGNKLLWMFPIPTTTGDGWSWEPSPKWLEARERIARHREEQRLREYLAGWGPEPSPPLVPQGAARHYVGSRPQATTKADQILGRQASKADQVLGRTESYADDVMSMENLRPRGPNDCYELSDDDHDCVDDEDTELQVLDRKPAVGWPRKFGVVANTLLGNTLLKQKDDVRGWDGQDDGVD